MISKEQIFELTTEENLIRHLVPEFDPTKKTNYRSIFSDKDEKPSLSIF